MSDFSPYYICPTESSPYLYDKQLTSKGNTWQLTINNAITSKSGKSISKSIIGLLSQQELDFGITNVFDAEAELLGGLGNTGFNQLKSAADKINKNMVNFTAAGKIFGNTSAWQAVEGANAASGLTEAYTNSANSMIDTIGNWLNSLNVRGLGTTRSLAKFLANSKAMKIGQSKLVSSLDKVPVFGGSTVDLPSFTLETYLFSHDGIDLKEELGELISVTLGYTYDEGGSIGMQAPPAGYQPSLNQINRQASDNGTSSSGTWTLRLGQTCTITNILVTDFRFTLNSARVLTKSGSSTVVKQDPVMAKLVFTIQIAGLLTRDDLETVLQLNA